MELDILEKANDINKRLSNLKKSKEHLTYFTKENEQVELRIYVGNSTDAFVIPKSISKRVIDLLHELLDEKTKELEQQFKEL